jgi:hypothetical protein
MDVDAARVVKRVAGLQGGMTIGPVVVKVEGLGGVDVVNAHIVLLNPAGVRADITAEMVKRIVVNVVLSALVVKVNLLLAVKLTVALMLDLWGDDLGKDIFILLDCTFKTLFGRRNINEGRFLLLCGF